MLLKSGRQLVIKVYRRAQSPEQRLGIFAIKLHNLMLVNDFFRVSKCAAKYKFIDCLPLKAGSTLKDKLGIVS